MPAPASAYVQRYRVRRRQRAIDYLGGKCARCERTDDLHFFHRDKPGKSDIAHAISQSWAWVRLKAELDICELLCPDHYTGPRPRGVDTGWRHGTLYGYDSKRCRCDECYAAKAKAWQRQGRKLLFRRPPGYFADHGSESRYQRGCRCRPCKEANRLRVARQRADRKARALLDM